MKVLSLKTTVIFNADPLMHTITDTRPAADKTKSHTVELVQF